MNTCTSNSNRSYFYFCEVGDSVLKILRRVYGQSISESQLVALGAVVLNNNPQITDARRLPAGMCVDLSPYRRSSFETARWRNDALRAASIWAYTPYRQKAAVENNPDIINYFLGFINDVSGVMGAERNALSKQLNYISKVITDHNGNVINLARQTFPGNAVGFVDQLMANIRRSGSEKELQRALNHLASQIRQAITENSKTSLPLFETNLNRVRKNMVRLPASFQSSYFAFSEYLELVVRLSQQAARWSTAASLAVPLSIGAVQIARDWNSPQRTETASLVTGNLLGGLTGGMAGYYLCTIIFFGESAGTSPLWCGLVASGAGGMWGSKAGERAAELGLGFSSENKPVMRSEAQWINSQ